MAADHSAIFNRVMTSIERGEKLIGPLKAYLVDPDFRAFDISIRNLGNRPPDGYFHPSEHPGYPERVLYLYLTQPELLHYDPWDPMTNISAAVGSTFHAIVQHILKDELKLLKEVEVRLFDPETGARGSMDGMLEEEGFEFKGLPLETPLPTPTGWTTMGEVQVGDALLGADGTPCLVTGMSTPKWVDGLRLSFDDGTEMLCDVEHRWLVAVGQSSRSHQRVMTGREILDHMENRRDTENRIRILNAAPLDLPDRDLPAHPYVLGAWIGDGSLHNATITQANGSGLWSVIEECGYRVGKPHGTGLLSRTVHGLRSQLRELHLLGVAKRIPEVYLRASRTQRLALLQGLMDTDGTWSALRKNAVYTTAEPELADQVRELVLSLGMRCRVQKFTARGFGVERQAFQVVFTPAEGVMPFIVKASRMEGYVAPVRSSRRVISKVERTARLRTKCVEVDSADHTYLCGTQMVPTHNTMSPRMFGKIKTAADFLERYPHYAFQAQEYMRMSGLQRMRVLCMVISFPFEMVEFTIDYDPSIAMATKAKYLTVRQAVADQRMPKCCGETRTCPARFYCAMPPKIGAIG